MSGQSQFGDWNQVRHEGPVRMGRNSHRKEDLTDQKYGAYLSVYEIPDTTQLQSSVTPEIAALIMTVDCRPFRAQISERQCQHLQERYRESRCATCERRGEPMSTSTIIDALGDLGGLVAGVRPELPGDFERLADGLEDCRDAVRDYLDGLPEPDRAKVEFYLAPHASRLADGAYKLATKAQAAGVIDERTAYDIGWLSVSLQFVTAQSQIIRPFDLEAYL
jgi:hypothetical protein